MRKKKVIEKPETNIIDNTALDEKPEEKLPRPEIEFITDDVQSARTEESGKTKTKTKKSKKLADLTDKVQIISIFPAIVLDAFFIRMGYSKLSEDEKNNLSEAFINFLISLPQSFIDYILKGSGIIGLVIVLSQIISKRQAEHREKTKQRTKEIDIEEFTQ